MRRYVGVLVIAVVLAGCAQTAGTEPGNFELLVSDQPAAIYDFDSLTVTFSGARVYGGANSSGPQDIRLDAPSVDLTTVVGDRSTRVARGVLEPGTYDRVEMDVAAVTGIVNGSVVDVKVPSETLKVQRSFTVALNDTTRFVFDIHVVRRGVNGYVLRPVIAQSGPQDPDHAENASSPGDGDDDFPGFPGS